MLKRLGFSARECRAILLLLPILGAVSYIMYRAYRPGFEENFVKYADATTKTRPDSIVEESVSLFEFDPNTIEFHDLCRLGFSRQQALSIIKFRTAGKIFSIPEDLAACYAVSEQMYESLRPYIKISSRYALKPAFEHTSEWSQSVQAKNDSKNVADTLRPLRFMPDTVSVNTLQKIGFSRKQSEAIIKYREAIGGFKTAEQVGRCYVISEKMFEMILPYMIFDSVDKNATLQETLHNAAKIEFNTADSATLRSVKGIGEKTVSEIILYRQRLGGFHSMEQIAEVRGVTEQNFERICEQIWIDTCKIRKIDINFAEAKLLEGHPYIPPARLRKLLKQRQLKGGWRSLEDLLNDKIFTPQEAKNIAPYLVFKQESPSTY